MQILASLYRDIRTHGEEAYPQECCGVLLGRLTARGWDVVKAIRTKNICEEPQHRYEISMNELVKIQREARNLGLEVAGFYHSHPESSAQWSSNDHQEAHWLGCLYVITSIVNGKAESSKAFLLKGTREEDKKFEPDVIHVEESLEWISMALPRP